MKLRRAAETIFFSAIYGFSIGSVHSTMYGVRNLIKFPLLLFLTGIICSICYAMFSKFITRKLSFIEIQLLTLDVFHDIALLLASLSPVCLFLAHTIIQPIDETNLEEYPLFLGLNVSIIAVCGMVALTRRAIIIIRRNGLSVKKGAAVLIVWLLITLFTGGQGAWYLRPFFGLPFINTTVFAVGKQPHVTGATNFYEAMWHTVSGTDNKEPETGR
ncbi:MAG: hypothetical protein GY757_43860 [bacterium]|nr:hypothetical protein [bacterium]